VKKEYPISFHLDENIVNNIPEMKEMTQHLRDNPNCKMLRVKDYE